MRTSRAGYSPQHEFTHLTPYDEHTTEGPANLRSLRITHGRLVHTEGRITSLSYNTYLSLAGDPTGSPAKIF
jgi:hypothetical protein